MGIHLGCILSSDNRFGKRFADSQDAVLLFEHVEVRIFCGLANRKNCVHPTLLILGNRLGNVLHFTQRRGAIQVNKDVNGLFVMRFACLQGMLPNLPFTRCIIGQLIRAHKRHFSAILFGHSSNVGAVSRNYNASDFRASKCLLNAPSNHGLTEKGANVFTSKPF